MNVILFKNRGFYLGVIFSGGSSVLFPLSSIIFTLKIDLSDSNSSLGILPKLRTFYIPRQIVFCSITIWLEAASSVIISTTLFVNL